MKTTLKVNDFVLTPDNVPGYVTEVHAKGKTAKVCLIGYYSRQEMCIKWSDTHLVKKLRPIDRTTAWKLAPRFPGIDC